MSPELRDLLGQICATLQAGAEASTAAQDSVIALTTLVERMKPARTPADAAPRKPFDISEYAATAHEISQAMRELQRLLTDVDPAAAAKILRSSVDHAFWRCAQLIALVLAASLLFAAVRARI